MRNLHLYILTSLLASAGIGLFLYKAWALGFPLSAGSVTSIWTLEAAYTFQSSKRPALLSAFVPKSSARFSLIDENYISRGFSLTTSITDSNRMATWSSRRPQAEVSLYYRATVRQTAPEELQPLKQPEIPEHGFEGAYLEAARAILDQAAGASSPAPLVEKLIGLLQPGAQDDNIRLLLEAAASPQDRADLVLRLLALNGSAARIANGIDLTRRGASVSLTHWIEVFEEQRWKAYDPLSGAAGLSGQYLPWWFGREPMTRLEGGEDLKTRISVQPSEEAAVRAALEQLGSDAPLLRRISLFDLPLAAQMAFHLLLLVPVGALIVVVLRNVIGLRTFGTFMPVLVALALRETGLLPGLALFCAIVLCGLAARIYLDRLKLLLVPRLAAVLTIVILLMAAVSLLTHSAGVGSGISAALFPMVIMTMTIERMSVVWDELGPRASLRQASGTLLVSSLIYAVIYSQALSHLVFVFPELLLVVLAAIILLGRYTGYRLLELLRFRALSDNSA